MTSTTRAARCLDPARPAEPWPTPPIPIGKLNSSVLVVRQDYQIEKQQVFLVRNDENPRNAFQRIPRKRAIPLGTNGNRGQVVVCVALERIPEQQQSDVILFQEPNEDEARLVAVKQLKKMVYNARFNQYSCILESNENPHAEIAAMHYLNPEASTNQHPVMGCMEALQDEEYLYIVMPYLSGGELHNHIPWAMSRQPSPNHMGISEAEAKVVFCKILRSVAFLHQRGVCHRDLKNENVVLQNTSSDDDVMQVPLTEMHPTVIDLAMSLKVPCDANGNFYKISNTQGPCGTFPFMAPEVFTDQRELDGFQIDVWSLGVMLFNLLTGRRLYRAPAVQDLHFKHFLVEGGLVDDELNQKWLQRAKKLVQQQQHQRFAWLPKLLEMIVVVQRLHPTTRILLQGMLCPDPNQRFTLQQVQQHEWFQM